MVDTVRATGRKQLLIAGLWTEIWGSMPAIAALADDYAVFAVTDASGGVSKEAHDLAILRMVTAGVTPIIWMAVTAEWQRDGAREASASAMSSALLAHGGSTSIALACKDQLLNTGNAPESMRRITVIAKTVSADCKRLPADRPRR